MTSKNYLIDESMYFVPIGSTSDRESSRIARPSREEYDKFYITYGECFAVWSRVEIQIFTIYMLLKSSSDYSVASAAFYSIIGFRKKLEKINDAVKNSKRVHVRDQKIWQGIFKGVIEQSRRRNQLAHNTICYGRLSGSGSRRMFVNSSGSPVKSPRLYLNNLVQIRDTFAKLQKRLYSFWLELQ